MTPVFSQGDLTEQRYEAFKEAFIHATRDIPSEALQAIMS